MSIVTSQHGCAALGLHVGGRSRWIVDDGCTEIKRRPGVIKDDVVDVCCNAGVIEKDGHGAVRRLELGLDVGSGQSTAGLCVETEIHVLNKPALIYRKQRERGQRYSAAW